jgi:hypothetical protein
MKIKWKYLFLSIIFFILGLILSHTYRPYIYSNKIFDFHIADTIGNIVAVPAAVCFFIALSRKKIDLKKIVIITVISYIGYEFLGLFGLHGVFDFYDIMATMISGIITYIILKNCHVHFLLNNRHKCT